MILPIMAYGCPVLAMHCKDISPAYPELQNLIRNMWDTMHHANGCGLAAPQIGLSSKLFIVDSKPTYLNLTEEERMNYFEGDQGITETFINAQIVKISDKQWQDEEGCLSIPGLTAHIKRPWSVTITYLDADFKEHTRTFSGITARMIQHEYDHINGKLYIDYLSPLRKQLMQRKLNEIRKGKIKSNYVMKFSS